MLVPCGALRRPVWLYIPHFWTHTHAALPFPTAPPHGARSQRHFRTYSYSVLVPPRLTQSRCVHYPKPWTPTPFAHSPRLNFPNSARLQRPFNTSSNVALTLPLFTMRASHFAALLVIFRLLFQQCAALSLFTLYSFTLSEMLLHSLSPFDMFPSWTRFKSHNTPLPLLVLEYFLHYPP